jgi:hypothetical protein
MLIKDAELISMSIQNIKSLAILSLKVQLLDMFNYMIWCDFKMLNCNINFVYLTKFLAGFELKL